jgi:hypothetical protein
MNRNDVNPEMRDDARLDVLAVRLWSDTVN